MKTLTSQARQVRKDAVKPNGKGTPRHPVRTAAATKRPVAIGTTGPKQRNGTAATLQPRPSDNVSTVLSHGQEFDLVQQLNLLRTKIDRLIRPALRDAPVEVRLDHFDQRLIYFAVKQGSKRPPKSFRSLLETYRRIKHALVVANLAWVAKLARAQRHGVVAEEDLFQEGVCGLLKAIDRFEAERGLRLMTYATWYIREAMQQVRARQSHLVALSSHDQTLLGQIEAQRTAFQHLHERLPNTTELKDRLHGSLTSLAQLQQVANPTVSLDRGAADGSIPVVVEDPVSEFDRQEEMHVSIARLLDELPSRERMIVTRRFGLDGQEPTSLEVLGGELNVSKERVRQLQRQAIRRMQRLVDEEHLQPASM